MDITPEKRVLLQRAISDPASITPEEKNQILMLPPPEEEARLHQSTFNLPSRAALVAKALPNDGADLSRAESVWLTGLGRRNPFEPLETSLDALERRLRGPAADRALLADARDAVTTTDERAAIRCAGHQNGRLAKEKAAERARIQALRELPRPRWLQELRDAAVLRWGFVVFRTAYGDDDAWRRFREYYGHTGSYAMAQWQGGSEMWPMHESVFVSDRAALEGADTAALRLKMQAMREAGEIPEGVRDDAFLVADETALSNGQVVAGERYSSMIEPSKTVFLRAVDPDHDSATPVPLEGAYKGFEGEITVPLPKVFDWLHYTLFSKSETWQVRYWQTTTKEWRPVMKGFSPYPGY